MGRFMVFLLVSTLLLIIINIYLSRKYKKLAKSYVADIPEYAAALILFSGILIFLSSIFLQNWIYQYRALTLPVRYISSFYLGFIIYSFMLFIAVDALRFLGSIICLPRATVRFLSKLYAGGALVPAVAVLITFYAYFNALNFKVTSYEININKPAAVSTLDIVMLSDLHVGTSVGKKELAKIKIIIEEMGPDMLVICGDLFDHASYEKIKKDSIEILGSIKPPLGTYFVTGNHEYYLGDMEKILASFDGSGITILRDELTEVEGIYIAGRNDIRETGRSALSDILWGADKTKPVLIFDHQPNGIDEAIENGADLQLSGHTHNGQLFPFNYIVGFANHTHYGIVESGKFKAVVSSGAGTWKYPIRTGSSSEIVRVRLNFINDGITSKLD